MTALDADFFVFSGHKIFGPTGIGVVYGKQEVLEEARPYQGGGNMIADVTFELTRYQPSPNKFEAGTGNITGVWHREAVGYSGPDAGRYRGEQNQRLIFRAGGS